MKLPKSTEKNGGVLPRLLLLGIALAFIPLALLAQQQGPGWWYQLPSGGAGPISATGTANDYAAANAGQLKNMAAAAAAEFDSLGLTGTFDNMVAQWNTPTAQTSDYSAVNLGQLKTVAQPFYDSLIAAGYLSGTDQYPWITSGNAPNDYAMANIGQVKNLFSFSTVPPVAPTNVVVQQNSDGSVTLTWTNNSVSASSVTIQESTDGGATWTQVATVSSNTTSYTIPAGSSGGSSATYQVSSTGGSGTASATPTPQPVPPVQSYAAIDVTGGTVSGSIGAVVLDDTNNGAFSYGSGGNGTYGARRWANGVPDTSFSNVMQADTISIAASGTSYTVQRTPSWLPYVDCQGTLIANETYTETSGSDFSSFCMGVTCVSSTVNPIELITQDFGGNYSQFTSSNILGYIRVTGASAHAYYGYAQHCDPYPDAWFIYQGGYTSVFLRNGYPCNEVTYPVYSNNSNYVFVPSFTTSLSGCGCALGTDASTLSHPAYWEPGFSSESGLPSVAGGYTGINDQGVIIGKDTDGFLWYNGTETALTSLIPSAYSSEISGITPRLISNSDTNGVIQILIDARFTDPSTTISSTNTYVLSGSYASLTRGSWALAQVQLPSGMSTANIHCINNSGILATANLPADGVSSSPVVGVLPPVTLTRHDAELSGSDVILDDWPANGSNPRSPKYLFSQDDSIKVTVPQIQGLQINVASETDPTGITFDPTQNTVRLGKTTGQQSGYVTISTTTKEVLTFSVVLNSSTSTGPTVMVGRAKFASCGIDIFYGGSTGDEAIVQPAAVTNQKFFEAGDQDYPNNVVSQGNGIKTFIQNAGNGSDGQASMLWISCDGGSDGGLYDHNTVNNQILTPGGANWNNDVEWVVFGACDELNDTGGGKAAWTAAMSGSPRPVHAFLGAYAPLDGNQQGEYSSFWSQVSTSPEYILNAYEIAMQFGGSEAQPWAMIANNNDVCDELKKVGPDGAAGTTYSYINVSVSVASRAGASGDSPIKGTFDSGSGLLRTDLPTGAGLQLQKAKQMHRSPDLTKTKHLGFVQKTSVFPDGRQDFVGNGLVQTRNQKTTLTKEQAASVATKYLADNFPEFASRAQLKEVSQRVVGTCQTSGTSSWANGYLVQFSIMNGGISVWDNYAAVIIRGNEVQHISFRYYDEGESSADAQANESITPKSAQDCLNQALPQIKSSLGIAGKYELLKAELKYVNKSVAQGKEANLSVDVIPAWHLLVNSSYQGEGSKRNKVFHVWLDALTGNFIGNNQY